MPSRLAQHLVARGLLPAERVNEALRQMSIAGGSLDTVLLEQGIVTEGDVLQALAAVSGFTPVNLAEFEANREVAGLIPPKISERLGVVPLSVEGATLHVACSYPVAKAELEEVGFLLGKQLSLWVAVEARVRDWISHIYGTPLPARYTSLLAQLDPTRPMPEPVAQAPAPAPVKAAAQPKTKPAPAPAPARPYRAPESEPEPVPANVEPEPEPAPQASYYLGEEPESAPAEAAEAEGSGRPGYYDLSAEAEDLGIQAATEAAQSEGGYDLGLEAAGTPEGAYYDLEPDMGAAAPAEPVPEADPSGYDVAHSDGSDEQGGYEQGSSEPQGGYESNTYEQGGYEQQQGYEQNPDDQGFQDPDAQSQGSYYDAYYDVNPEQPPAPMDEPPPASEEQDGLVEDSTLEDSLTLQMVERLAQRVADEPIPLSTKKSRKAAAEALPPEPPMDEAPAPAPARSAGKVAPAAPPRPQVARGVPDWTLEQARAALKEFNEDREQLIDVILRFARKTFDFVAAFAVIRGQAVGWDVRGEGVDRATLSQVSIPLDSASVFRTVALTRGSYMGPLPPDALSKHFLELFGRAPRAVFLFPVEVKARLVAIIYGDSGQKPVSQRKLSELILFCQDLPPTFQELIVRRKHRGGMNVPIVADDVEDVIPTAKPSSTALGWSPFTSTALGGLGRAASTPALAYSEGNRPPPDFAPLLKRLTGPDAAQRARAMAELARTPHASAIALAREFPGPTAWSRMPIQELPEADELGPIPGALSRLGRQGAQALAPLLDADDSDTRYLALLTAGNLPFPELVDGILRGLFDYEPDISSAARAAAACFKKVTRFDASMKDLRQELTARDSLRRALAARALGLLHDREAIDGLIGMTGSDDQMCAQAAADALREITRASFGTQPRLWQMWWAENRGRRRAEWLVAALRHPELDIRQAAIEELARALNDSLGYEADASNDEREMAVRRWEQLLSQRGRGAKLDV